MAKKKASLLTSKPKAAASNRGAKSRNHFTTNDSQGFSTSKSKTSVLKTKPSLKSSPKPSPKSSLLKAKPSPTRPAQGKPKTGLLKAKTTRRTDEVKRKALAVAGAEDLKRLNLNVSKSFHAKVKTFAIMQGDDISGVVVAALNEYMSKRSK